MQNTSSETTLDLRLVRLTALVSESPRGTEAPAPKKSARRSCLIKDNVNQSGYLKSIIPKKKIAIISALEGPTEHGR